MTIEQKLFQFNPDSAMGKVNRYKGTALGGGTRALHMQIAHPLVAQALDDTNFLRDDPFKRLKKTLDAGIDMTFGSVDKVQEVAGNINKMHQHVYGVLKETTGAHKKGDPYSALDQNLLAWVGSTLIDSSIFGYEMFIGDLTLDQKDEYLNNAKDLFKMVNLDPATLPRRYEGLKEYMQDMVDTEQVKVGALAKELAPYTTLSNTGFVSVSTYGLRRITAYSLPDDIREQFGYSMPDWERSMIKGLAEATKATVPLMPEYMRYFKQYRDAQRIIKKSF